MNDPNFGWNDFSNAVEDKFVPLEMRWQKHEEFGALYQGNLSLADYIKKFTELSKYGGEEMRNELMMATRFVRRMEPKLRAHVTGLNC